jgi:hypothetical protein
MLDYWKTLSFDFWRSEFEVHFQFSSGSGTGAVRDQEEAERPPMEIDRRVVKDRRGGSKSVLLKCRVCEFAKVP